MKKTPSNFYVSRVLQTCREIRKQKSGVVLSSLKTACRMRDHLACFASTLVLRMPLTKKGELAGNLNPMQTKLAAVKSSVPLAQGQSHVGDPSEITRGKAIANTSITLHIRETESPVQKGVEHGFGRSRGQRLPIGTVHGGTCSTGWKSLNSRCLPHQSPKPISRLLSAIKTPSREDFVACGEASQSDRPNAEWSKRGPFGSRWQWIVAYTLQLEATTSVTDT